MLFILVGPEAKCIETSRPLPLNVYKATRSTASALPPSTPPGPLETHTGILETLHRVMIVAFFFKFLFLPIPLLILSLYRSWSRTSCGFVEVWPENNNIKLIVLMPCFEPCFSDRTLPCLSISPARLCSCVCVCVCVCVHSGLLCRGACEQTKPM